MSMPVQRRVVQVSAQAQFADVLVGVFQVWSPGDGLTARVLVRPPDGKEFLADLHEGDRMDLAGRGTLTLEQIRPETPQRRRDELVLLFEGPA